MYIFMYVWNQPLIDAVGGRDSGEVFVRERPRPLRLLPWAVHTCDLEREPVTPLPVCSRRTFAAHADLICPI